MQLIMKQTTIYIFIYAFKYQSKRMYSTHCIHICSTVVYNEGVCSVHRVPQDLFTCVCMRVCVCVCVYACVCDNTVL